MKSHDLNAVMKKQADWVSEDGDAEFWILDSIDDGRVWMGRFKGTSPWTCHPDADALIHQLEGESVLTVRVADTNTQQVLKPGQIFVVRRHLWYRVESGDLSLQYGTSRGETLHSKLPERTH
ncbi:hypothetical protein ACFSJ3_05740 [Corallincola platygyrae]|uniref:Cupin domain-containing protein n=1 Tax=Corallincola platygyrae TaxID=1193278 RepID=A0ABW4XIW9_9GAMM